MIVLPSAGIIRTLHLKYFFSSNVWSLASIFKHSKTVLMFNLIDVRVSCNNYFSFTIAQNYN